MKKLFISCPMKGRSEENVKKSMEKLHKMAEIIFDEELEVIDSYIDEEPESKNIPVWYLGKSIQMLAEADFFIGILYSDYWRGCMIEKDVANAYGIRSTLVDIREIMPDACEIESKYREDCEKSYAIAHRC